VPNSNFAFSLGYNYTDLYMQSYICIRDTGFGIPPYAPCPFFSGTNAITLGAMSFYSNKQHFAYADVMWKPANRVTVGLGYSGTFTGGDTLFLNPRMLGGTLAFNYQKPYWAQDRSVQRSELQDHVELLRIQSQDTYGCAGASANRARGLQRQYRYVRRALYVLKWQDRSRFGTT